MEDVEIGETTTLSASPLRFCCCTVAREEHIVVAMAYRRDRGGFATTIEVICSEINSYLRKSQVKPPSGGAQARMGGEPDCSSNREEGAFVFKFWLRYYHNI